MERNKLEEARKRAQIISHRIRLRVDEAVRAKILAFSGDLTGRPEQYGIDLVAWRGVTWNRAVSSNVSSLRIPICYGSTRTRRCTIEASPPCP